MNLGEKATKENLTPLMKQYEELKSVHADEILLFRLGDFYEIFGRDAQSAASALEVALTQRQGVPMCGVPHHALDRYLPKLLKKNFRVAIAEQMEDPATTKGIVKREVVRVISAGTLIEEKLLNDKSNNFLAAVSVEKNGLNFGLAALDISTGQFTLTEMESGHQFSNLANELSRIQPAEILLQKENPELTSCLNGVPVQFVQASEGEAANRLLERAAEIKNCPEAVEAAKMVLGYIKKMNPALLPNVQAPQWSAQKESMALDKETIGNLEILKNSFDGSSEKTLLSFLDRTLTPMGGRLLKQWLVRPLVDLQKIQRRLETVEFFVRERPKRNGCREGLKGVSDLERIVGRVVSGQINPRDIIALKLSLLKVRTLKKSLELPSGSGPSPKCVQEILAQIEDWSELIDFIGNAVVDEPPVYLQDGGIIRQGYDAPLDEIRKASQEGKLWLENLEKKEKEKTQISTLKVGYTSVFGYYFEVTKPHLPKVPPDWHRKQTLIHTERFVNEELKTLEQKILGAEEQCLRIERRLFQQITDRIKLRTEGIQKTAKAVSELDCFLSLAEVAEIKALSKPDLDLSDHLKVTEGWHPAVKESIPPGAFVPNDTLLDGQKNQIIILTAPNMSGKSTYLRQVAVIVLMAQIGSFVPAQEAHIGLVDRIFTRIGSGDRLAQGESTFMVEMQETAKILNYATSRSLIILDEVGRGTSTYDGISIAWSVVEYLTKQIKPKVLFATHYFELTHLAHEIEGIKNYNVEAKERGDSVLFLHKIAPGPADRSYGIHVAQLAGLPEPVIQKAKKILNKLEQEHHASLKSRNSLQPELFSKL